MIEEVRLRRAGARDARAIARVHVESWRVAYAGLVPDEVLIGMTVEEKAERWRRILAHPSPRSFILAAESLGGELVGFANGSVRSDGPSGFGGEVEMLYVAPDWQGQGTGRRLLRLSLLALGKLGAKGGFLWVLSDNPSRFFYEAMGGKRLETRTEKLWGAELPETAYGWPDLAALPPVLQRGVKR